MVNLVVLLRVDLESCSFLHRYVLVCTLEATKFLSVAVSHYHIKCIFFMRLPSVTVLFFTALKKNRTSFF